MSGAAAELSATVLSFHNLKAPVTAITALRFDIRSPLCDLWLENKISAVVDTAVSNTQFLCLKSF